MLPQVIVRDAGAGVDGGHEGLHALVGHFGRAERGDETQLGGLEVGPEPADDLALPQAAQVAAPATENN